MVSGTPQTTFFDVTLGIGRKELLARMKEHDRFKLRGQRRDGCRIGGRSWNSGPSLELKRDGGPTLGEEAVQLIVVPPPVRSSVCKEPPVPGSATSCSWISAKPWPGWTWAAAPKSELTMTPPTTMLLLASARGSRVIEGVGAPPLEVLTWATSATPSYSNTDQAQRVCCSPPKSKLSGP